MLSTLVPESRTAYNHQNAIFTCCSCLRKNSAEHFYHSNTIAGTLHTEVVVMPVQYPVTSKVRSVFLYSLRQNLHLLTGGIWARYLFWRVSSKHLNYSIESHLFIPQPCIWWKAWCHSETWVNHSTDDTPKRSCVLEQNRMPGLDLWLSVRMLHHITLLITPHSCQLKSQLPRSPGEEEAISPRIGQLMSSDLLIEF